MKKIKKLVFYLIILFTTSLLFAKQPFFLENWIIPEDFEWGTGNKIPEIEGKFFYQIMDSVAENPSVFFLEKKMSNMEIPTYFVENNLIDWDKTYGEILSAFNENQLFFTSTYLSAAIKKDNPSNPIDFNDVLRITCRQDNNFVIEIQFPHARTQEEQNNKKPGFFSIYCYKNGLNKFNRDLPPKEIFEREYRTEWETYTTLERNIIALSYFLLKEDNFLPARYDCTASIYNTYRNPAEQLKKSFDITNKEELLDFISEKEYEGVTGYKEMFRDLAANPDKNIIELAEENRYNIKGVSRLFFIDNMKDVVDENILDVYIKVRSLLVLRYGTGAGLITREESVEYAKPIVEKLLKQYVSYEDFAAHLALSQSYFGLTNEVFVKMPVEIMKSYAEFEQYISIEDLHFDGSEAGDSLTFDDCYYKPQGEALWWLKVQKESNKKDGKELSAIKEGMAQYGTALCLRNLLKAIDPKKYDSAKDGTEKEFFDANYKDIWNKLSENEKYAIAFSSNLFELNNQYHLDFDGIVTFSRGSSDCKGLLADSWSINNHDELVDTFNSLEESGHSGAYLRLCNILNKYPEQDVFDIAEQEHLTIQETCRLCFVKDTRALTGSHGIEAWDEGREITILRWGIACGFISSEEAMKLIEPVIKRIRQNYVSFEDYIAHYIIGRQFFGLYEGNYELRAATAKYACVTAAAYIAFDDLIFTAENADTAGVMTYNNCTYLPSDSFRKWERVMAVYRPDTSEETLAAVEQLEKELPEFKNLLFNWHLTLLVEYDKPHEVIKLTEENMDYLNSYPKDGMDYSNMLYMYMACLNNTYQPMKVIQIFGELPENFMLTTYELYQYGYANYLMMDLCSTQSEYEVYKQTAIGAFTILQQYNYEIPGLIQNWMEIVH